ncbi:MAG: class I SAM-dependent RNA methyltransferase [Lachnospiraceae bacterium]|nr:class I SAM-dependent RNA methyltransferase [Lachnospiraceae bacterium]
MAETYELIAPCHFGMEAVLKREIAGLGYPVLKTEDGKVSFEAEPAGVARANIFLRTPERILVKAAQFRAVTFEELFEKVRSVDWASFIPQDGRVWVKKANSVKSRLFSPSDIQSVVKKAIVEKLKAQYRTDVIPETGNDYPLRISILKDEVVIGLDSSGESLHKRGYRTDSVKAPISETLASAILLLSPWRPDRILVDPFCGSGTFCIEAAMMACGIAPGMNREFTAEKWTNLIPKRAWYDAVNEAMGQITVPQNTDIQGYDIDPAAIRASRENAKRAGVAEYIHFETRDVKNFSHRKKYGFVITNPPYGERIAEAAELPPIYRTLGERFSALDSWSMYMITSYEKAEEMIGRKADKNRKIYNGMLKTYLYEFMGPKPPKRERHESSDSDR